MRHDNIEHPRRPPKPFTICGTLGVILHCLGMPADTTAEAMEQAFLDDGEFMHSGIPCAVIKWECHVKHDGLRVYTVNATPLRFVSKSEAHYDPWVVVGTTTIDGTIMQVATAVEASAWGPPVDENEAVVHIDHFACSGEPWLIGGRHLRAHGSHINVGRGTAFIRCDIVRRLSECCLYCDHEHLSATQRERAPECESCTRSIEARLSAKSNEWVDARPQCPECGPHGNAGRVLLLESWVDCTTCRCARPSPEDACCRSCGRPALHVGAHLFIDGECPTCRGHKPAYGLAYPAADGGEGAPFIIDLEKDVIEVSRTRYRKLDPQTGQVDFSQKSMPGLAYPTADDVRSSLPTPIESREYLGHVLKTFTPPPMSEVAQRGARAFMQALAPLQFNDDNIGKAMRMMDEHIDKCQARLRELGLV